MIPEYLLFQVDPIMMPFSIGYRNIFFALLFAGVFTFLFFLIQRRICRPEKTLPVPTYQNTLNYDVDDISSMIRALKHLLSPQVLESEAYTAREIQSQKQNQTTSALLVSLEDRVYRGETLSRAECEQIAREIERLRK